jgi:mRNA-degrading endonuclease RelE of RelBE toxin-antitoxin system
MTVRSGARRRPITLHEPRTVFFDEHLEGLYSARRGDHRIIYRIDDGRRVILIEAIAHRADVYRRS